MRALWASRVYGAKRGGAATVRGTRAAAVTAALLVSVAACGGGGGGDGDTAPSSGDKNGSSDGKTSALIKKTNKAMSSTSFKASGSGSGFSGGDIWWDPDEGLRMKVRTDDGLEGQMFCQDGTTFVSAPLLAEMYNPGGENQLPPELTDVYVTVPATGKTCQSYFAIPESAKRVPKKDGSVDGRKTVVVKAESAQRERVYHIASSGKSHVLKLDMIRDGEKSTTTFSGYGGDYDISMPPKEQRMEMGEFQKKLTGGS